MTATWRHIPGFPDYEVSDHGNVRSLRLGPTPRPMKPWVGTKGYLRIQLRGEGKSHDFPVHRLVALAFIPNPESLPLVRHLNDIKTDNRIENLAWGTGVDNMNDAFRNESIRCALTVEQIEETLMLHAAGWTLRQLGAYYGVSYVTIYNHLKGLRGRHLGGLPVNI